MKTIQIIVVDYNSDKYLSEYNNIKENSYYNHVVFTENNTNKRGIGICINIGLKFAKVELILVAYSDDFFIEGFYEKVKKYFNTDNDVVYFTATSIELDIGDLSNRHQTYEEIILNYKEKQDLKSQLELKYIFIVPWSKLIRKKFINENNIKFKVKEINIMKKIK